MHAAAPRRLTAIALMVGLSWLAPVGGARGQGFDLARVRAQDARLATTALRVGKAAAAACPTTALRPGWTLHNLSQYAPGDRPPLTEALHLDRVSPGLFALAAGGPAATAGLQPDDVIVAANGAALGEDPTPEASFEPLRRQLDRLDAAFAGGPVALRIRRGGQARAVTFSGERVCGVRAQLGLTLALSAEADEQTLSVSLGLAEFAQDDAEFAFIVGHELAHVIHGDRARRLAAGTGWTEADQVAAERAADLLGADLAASAGYAPTAAATFWRRLATTHPGLDQQGGGHPSTRDRAAAAER